MSNLSKLQKDVIKIVAQVREQRRKNKMSYKIIEAVKRINYKDLGMRALWTFLQAFLAVLLVMAEQIIDLLFVGDWNGLRALSIATLLGGIAAGLSALKTLILETVKSIRAQS